MVYWFKKYILDPTNGLKLVQTISRESLKALGDTNDVYVNGIRHESEDSILLADRNNSNIKRLQMSSGNVSVVYNEPNKDWYIKDVGYYVDSTSRLLVLLEKKGLRGIQKTRVVLLREKAGKFQVTQEFPLEDVDVCTCSVFQIP